MVQLASESQYMMHTMKIYEVYLQRDAIAEILKEFFHLILILSLVTFRLSCPGDMNRTECDIPFCDAFCTRAVMIKSFSKRLPALDCWGCWTNGSGPVCRCGQTGQPMVSLFLPFSATLKEGSLGMGCGSN